MEGFIFLIRFNSRCTLIFLIGFVVGTLIMSKTFLTSEFEDRYSTKSSLWLTKKKYNANLAFKLQEEVKVLCMVMTNPDNHREKADHVKSTWGKRCNKLLFITTQDDDNLDTIIVPIEESRMALRRKTKTAFLHAHDNYLNEYDWFLKADDDSYVIMENLRNMLYQYNKDTALFFGHRMTYNRSNELESFMTGGCYVLSRKALSKFNTTVNEHPKNFFWPDQAFEDVEMGRTLSHNAISADSRDELHQIRFFTISIKEHLKQERPKNFWYFDRMYYDVAQGSLDCCSDVAVSFHYVKPKAMYWMEYFIYHIHPFGIDKNLTETWPRKLGLKEIIAASDSRRLELDEIFNTSFTNVHNVELSEVF